MKSDIQIAQETDEQQPTEIKNSKSLLIIVYLWIFVALVNMVTIFFMFPSIFVLLPITVEFLAILNTIIYYKLYKEPIIISEGKISFYGGWPARREECSLAAITSVKCTKSAMIFHIGGVKKTLGLGFVRKEDEIIIFQYLENNNVNIQF